MTFPDNMLAYLVYSILALACGVIAALLIEWLIEIIGIYRGDR